MFFKTRLDETLGFVAYEGLGSLMFEDAKPYFPVIQFPAHMFTKYANTDYALVSSVKPTPVLRMDADLAGDTSTTGLITIGGVSASHMDFDNDQDWFRIDIATAGEIYNFFAQGANGDVIFNTQLGIYDANGLIVYITPAGKVASAGRGRTSVELAYEFVNSGTYYVNFSATHFGGTGNYEITTTRVTDDFEDDMSTTAVLPSTGELISGELQHYLDSDWFTLDAATDGDILQFKVTVTDRVDTRISTLGPTIFIYNSSGDLIDSRGSRNSGQSPYDFGFTEAGQYFIEIRSSANLLQNYTLSANTISSDDYADGPNTTGRLTIDGGTVSGNIQFEKERDWFKLDVSQDDQHVQFHFNNVSSQAIAFSIFSANGELVRTFHREYIHGLELNLDHIFDDGGQYYIEFRNIHIQNAIGQYTFEAITLVNITSLTTGSNTYVGDANDNRIEGLAGNDDLSGGLAMTFY